MEHLLFCDKTGISDVENGRVKGPNRKQHDREISDAFPRIESYMRGKAYLRRLIRGPPSRLRPGKRGGGLGESLQ